MFRRRRSKLRQRGRFESSTSGDVQRGERKSAAAVRGGTHGGDPRGSAAWARLYGEQVSAIRVNLDGGEIPLDIALSNMLSP